MTVSSDRREQGAQSPEELAGRAVTDVFHARAAGDEVGRWPALRVICSAASVALIAPETES